MPRGQRKSLEEKIQAKQELINALNIRIESEERELEELYEQKRRKELEAVSDLIEDAGLAPEEVAEVLQHTLRTAAQMHREIAGERELAHLKEPELYRPKVRNRINLMTGGRYTPGLFLCPFGYRQSCKHVGSLALIIS